MAVQPPTASTLFETDPLVSGIFLPGDATYARKFTETMLHDRLRANPWFCTVERKSERGDLLVQEGLTLAKHGSTLVLCAIPQEEVRALIDDTPAVLLRSAATIAFSERFVSHAYKTTALAASLASWLKLDTHSFLLTYGLTATVAGFPVEHTDLLSAVVERQLQQIQERAASDTYEPYVKLSDRIGVWPLIAGAAMGVRSGIVRQPNCGCGASVNRIQERFRCAACSAEYD